MNARRNMSVKLNKGWVVLVAIAAFSVFACVSCVEEGTRPFDGEFQVDEHTLFLAHFNGSLQADYARGNPVPSGNMGFTEGRFGQGIYAIRGLIQQENVFTSPFFRMLRYDHQENFDVEQGTLEMWVKPYFGGSVPLSYLDPLKEKGYMEGRYYRYFLFHIAIAPGNRQIGLYIREDQETGENMVVFHEMHERGDVHEVHEDDKNWFLVAGDSPLEKGRWHHIAAVWDSGMRAIYIDGRKAAKRSAEGGLPSFAPGARPMAVGSLATYSDQPAEAVIDEVRISSVKRYEGAFTW